MRRHELTDEEWVILTPLLPNKPHGVARVDDRRRINGILRRFRTSAPWWNVPERYGLRATLYNVSCGGRRPGSGTSCWKRSQPPMTAIG